VTEPSSIPPAEASARARLQRLSDFLALDPRNAGLLRELAREALRAGRWEAVPGAVQRLRLLGEERAPERRLLVNALRAAGRGEEADAALDEAHARWPEDAGLALERSRVLAAAGDLAGALQALPATERAGAEAGAACAWRVRLLHHLGRLDEAEAAACEHAARHGADDEVEASLLAVLVDASRLDEAAHRAAALAARCRAAGAAFPYAAAEPLALAALREGRGEAAREWTDRALAQRDDDGRLWLVRGLTHLVDGQGADAEQALERAVAALPEHPGSLLALGWVRLLRGARAEARQAFDRALAASPALADAHGSLAVLEAFDGRPGPARDAIRRAEGLEPDHPAARLAAARLEGRCSEAEVRRLAGQVALRSRRPAAAIG
jgi:Flp pilus assembly protein TadD